ncbi:hypothetical protein SynROS8604_00305 [Synechococcus sp. ROS8604]|nr:hypothetical protein SynROS8604_00305 [Synechococcus sp. ROS8604]
MHKQTKNHLPWQAKSQIDGFQHAFLITRRSARAKPIGQKLKDPKTIRATETLSP